MTKKVCVVEGDDAAPEAMKPTLEILRAMNLDIQYLIAITGEPAKTKYDVDFPDEARKMIDEADCTLFGSCRFGPGSKQELGTSVDVLSYLRWTKNTYAGMRIVKWVKGMKSPLRHPEDVDFIIVREQSEGLYPGREADLSMLEGLNIKDARVGVPLDTNKVGKFALKVCTEEASRRIARVACEYTRKGKQRGRKGNLTCVGKGNIMPQTEGLFRTIVEEAMTEYPDIEYNYLYIDAFLQDIIIKPETFDVCVMANEYADIAADAGAAIAGGVGTCPSANIGDESAYFEPIHGSAPDIAGKNIINPTATILSAALMLDYLGMEEHAERLSRAVYSVYEQGDNLTPDQGGTATTTEFCEAVLARL